MDSVISKEQLDMLLGSMRNSIPTDKVLKSLEQTCKLGTLEKNLFYHDVLKMIKDSNNPKDASILILRAVEDLLQEKINTVAQSMEIAGTEVIDSPGPGKQSPIFRRVG